MNKKSITKRCSIEGISTAWGFESGDEYKKIGIELYERGATITGDDYIAYKRGEYDLNQLPWSDPSASVTGGTCAKVLGRVEYRHDLYCIEYPDDETADFILFMIPINLTGIQKDGTFSCNECGGKTPSNYAGVIEAGVKERKIALGSGSGYMTWSTSLTFTIGIKVSQPVQYAGPTVIIDFSFTFKVSSSNVYYEARPKILIVKADNYVNKDLYYWFEGTPSTMSEALHFSWTPP